MRSLSGVVCLSLAAIGLALLSGILLVLVRILGTLDLLFEVVAVLSRTLGRFAPMKAIRRVIGFRRRSEPPAGDD